VFLDWSYHPYINIFLEDLPTATGVGPAVSFFTGKARTVGDSHAFNAAAGCYYQMTASGMAAECLHENMA
jgi:hypothetical protein